MSTQRALQEVPRIGLSVSEAAESLSISRDSFERFVLPEVRSARIGRRRIIAVTELQRWLDRNQGCILDDLRG